MTHKDIYIKFMIEYDKANVTSSYPSLTEYEVATVLDKAYNALIAQKVTGNNFRHSMFESDIKAIADLEPLVRSEQVSMSKNERVNNSIISKLPNDMLYYITSYLKQSSQHILHDQIDAYTEEPKDTTSSNADYKPADGWLTRSLLVRLMSHDMATKFFVSPHNIPWVKDPVAYIENNKLHVVYDPINIPNIGENDKIDIVYIKKPNTFVKDLNADGEALAPNKEESVQEYLTRRIAYRSYFDYQLVTPDNEDEAEVAEYESAKQTMDEIYNFECNNTMAEELISLAVAFALENVESLRLTAKLNMRGLEA